MRQFFMIMISILCLNCNTSNNEMKTAINKLDYYLREKRPEYYRKLQNPLTEKEISDLEAKYDVKLPSDLKELYLWKNGQSQETSQAFVNNAMFEPLEEVLIGGNEFTEMIGYDFEMENWWNENWFPIFSNGGGSFICYDLKGVFTGQKGQLIEFWNADNDRNVIAPNLVSFLNSLNQYYESTSKNDFDEYFDINESISQWRKSFIVDKPIKK